MDLSKVRADTPAVEYRAYLHNAGAALMPRSVVKAMKDHIDLEAAIGGYAAARRGGGAARLSMRFRASPHYYNTEEEVDRLVDICMQLAKSA